MVLCELPPIEIGGFVPRGAVYCSCVSGLIPQMAADAVVQQASPGVPPRFEFLHGAGLY